ncbi:MAG: acetolactate synthase [Ruminococcaceae bacterium]|nr:acetolactate synthase [Oscillospiraceae bacterium]
MSVKQISIFIENKKGSLSEVTKFIAESKINLLALSIADTQDFGILRIITEDADKARDILRDAGYTAVATSVLAAALDDTPGSMANILEILTNADINVEYTYAFMSHIKDKAYMIFRVDNNDKATKALIDANISVIDQKDIFGK